MEGLEMGAGYIPFHKERYRRGRNVVFSPDSPKTLQKLGVLHDFGGKVYIGYIKSCNFVTENVTRFFSIEHQKVTELHIKALYTRIEKLFFYYECVHEYIQNYKIMYKKILTRACVYRLKQCNFVTFNDLIGEKCGYILVTWLHKKCNPDVTH